MIVSQTKLIERWLPIAELSEESIRERRSMTALPPVYYLHVWWARRPLVASRAAVLASLLPHDTNREAFMHALGIHGDPIAAKRRIADADRKGERLGKDAYGYKRAFTFQPSQEDLEVFTSLDQAVVLDPTAGGGAIPLEATRLGLETFANDLNPVAATVLKATIEWPQKYGDALVEEITQIGKIFRARIRSKFAAMFPPEPREADRTDAYLWARTIRCPYCSGLVPLSPHWRLSPGGIGVKLRPQLQSGAGDLERQCEFEIVHDTALHSPGTISGGDATCPFDDCGRIIDGDEVKRQAQADGLGEQLYAIVYKTPLETRLKSGKRGKDKWSRRYRSPTDSDDMKREVDSRLQELLPEWELLNLIPNEEIPLGSKTEEPLRYGAKKWTDLFSPRQLLGHGFATQLFRELVDEDSSTGRMTEIRRAAYVYLSFSLDKCLNYNSRMSIWMSTREVIANTFNRHDFAFCWSYAEMAIMLEGNGYDWAVEQTAKSVKELVELTATAQDQERGLFGGAATKPAVKISVSSRSGANLEHIADGSVDAVVMDPPYGANVMYAELSDFFYVWLKRTAGAVFPDLFTRRLTDKQAEAVANKSHFRGQKGAEALANRDYQEKMSAIFAECRRVLKDDGVMTVMFTHKDTGAWDALTKGLIEAGFVITASWPVNTEAEGSLHIKDKAAANSTIFLVCRLRSRAQGAEIAYWEDVEPMVASAVRTRVEEFQKAGITGVDLYLASFGPALEEFSRHWPLKRGTPRPEPQAKRRRKQAELFDEEFDPYAVSPEDALDAARREVKTWRLNKLTHMKGKADLDPVTSWFVLAWDAFRAPVFSYDEGLRLARAVGADLDSMVGKICEKKGSDLKLWDSATRAAKSNLGSPDGSRSMLDAIHSVAHRARTRSLDSALELIRANGLESDQQFFAALEAVLEVLPPSKSFIGFDVATGDAKDSSDDFEALEKLRRLAFADKVDEPEQLALFAADKVAAE
jgi:putative DNA methylase